MIMKRILTIISLAALMMPVSCVKDNLDGHDFDQAGKGMKFTAVMEYSASKTTLEEDGANQGAVSWSLGDKLKFDFEVGKVNYEPVISLELEEIDGGVATFHANVPRVFGMSINDYKKIVGEEMAGWRHMYVSYPFNLTTEYTWSSYHVEIPTLQDGTFASASIALAKWNPAKPNDNLNFMNLCGLLQVKIAEDDADVAMIKVTSNQVIAGMMDISFTEAKDNDGKMVPFIKGDIDGSRMIQVKVHGAGTYYVAVRPDIVMENLYVELCDADGNGVGDRMAKSDVLVERSHILPLGTLGKTDTFVGEGDYFVKPAGTGDGSSWDNAANYETFRSKLAKSVANETAVVHMATGEYEVTSVANVSAAKNYTILGGYPDNAKGTSLSGRDPFTHPTVLKSTVAANRIWNFAAGTYHIDGITMTGCVVSNVGSAFSIKKTAVVTCYDCVFTGNTSSKYGGAVGFENLTSTDSKFVNCQFVGNSATGTNAYGGALSSNNTTTNPSGTVSFEKCLFKENTSEAAGGAAVAEFVNYRFDNCTFVDNTDNAYISDAVYLKGSNGVSVYCDACNFYYTASDYFGTAGTNGSGSILKNNAGNGVLAINNSLVTGPWGMKTVQIITGDDSAVTIIANSTLFSQTGYPAVLANKGTTHVLNSIVLNAASSGSGRGLATNGKSEVRHSVLTKVDESGTVVSETTSKTTYENNLIVVSHQNETFPVEPTWYRSNQGAADMWGNKNAEEKTVADCRDKLYYYAWDGVYPDDATFINTTLENVTNLVKEADAGFAEWLGANSTDPNDNRLGQDIRGVQRNANSMWPGSYQN